MLNYLARMNKFRRDFMWVGIFKEEVAHQLGLGELDEQQITADGECSPKRKQREVFWAVFVKQIKEYILTQSLSWEVQRNLVD